MAELLKLTEVAQELGISEPTARRYVKTGKLPSIYVGGRYRVRREDIEEFLRQAQVRPGENLPLGGAPSSDLELSSSEVLAEERRASETAVAVTAWWIGGERYNVVKWNVPLEERGRYRGWLREMFPDEDYIEVAFGARPQEEAERIMSQISEAVAQAS